MTMMKISGVSEEEIQKMKNMPSEFSQEMVHQLVRAALNAQYVLSVIACETDNEDILASAQETIAKLSNTIRSFTDI